MFDARLMISLTPALVALVLAPPIARADDAPAVNGRVIDAGTGAPIADATVLGGAAVALADADADAGAGAGAGATSAADLATYSASAISGADGRFVLTSIADGAVALSVSAPGYLAVTITVEAGDRAGTVYVPLELDAGGEVIEITGEAPELAATTSYALDRDQVRALPGTGDDILRALQALPGVARLPYSLGGLILRGTNPGDTRVFLDGIEVPLAFHFGGVRSFYPSALLEDVSISPGTAEAARGRGLGGVVELRSRAPRTDRWRVGGEVGVFDASSYAEGPVGGGGIAFGVRRSYIDAILPSLIDDDDLVLPRYYDGQARWDRAVGGGDLTALLFFSDDGLRVVSTDGVFDNSFARAAARYRRRAGATTLTTTPWLGVGRMRFSSSDYDDSKIVVRHIPFGLRADAVHDTAWGHLAAGVDLHFRRTRLENQPDPDADPGDDEGGLLVTGVEDVTWRKDLALWTEARWRIDGGKLSVKPGLRLDYFAAHEHLALSPRLVVSHELAPWLTTRETIGIHRPAEAGQRAIHASVGAELDLPAAVEASVTSYYVDMQGDEVAPGELDPGPTVASGLGVLAANLIGEELGSALTGRQRSYGLELSVLRRGARSTCWASYTLSRSEHHPGPVDTVGWRPTGLDQTHNLNVVGSVRLGAWQLGARLRYVTGFPYTPLMQTGVDERGEPTWTDGEPHSARMADFTSLDLRVDRRWVRPWGVLSFFLDVQNATNATNPEGAETDPYTGETRTQNGLPILPMFGLAFAPP